MPNSPDLTPEGVARSLSEKQRRDLVAGNCVDAGNPECVCQSKEVDSLRALGLAENGRQPLFTGAPLTALGAAVKQYLETHPHVG